MAKDPGRVLIFDTTLRDGEQSPGASLNLEEKLAIAQQLARLGVDVIEAGFPFASPGDFAAVQRIAQQVGGDNGPIICGLARASRADIKACADAVDRAFELTGTVFDGLEEIGHGQTEIVVAVHRDHGIADVGHVLIDACDQRAELRRCRVADGVGNVDRGGAGSNRRLNHLIKELRVAAAGVFTGELNIFHQRTGVAHHLGNDAEHVGTALAQLVLEVDVAGGNNCLLYTSPSPRD